MTEKSISFTTNFNGKLSCHCFIHLDYAPTAGIPESRLQETVIEIKTIDKSHPPVKAKLVDVARILLAEISAVITWQSHGMNAEEFKNWLEAQNNAITPTTKMAIYLYKKIQE